MTNPAAILPTGRFKVGDFTMWLDDATGSIVISDVGFKPTALVLLSSINAVASFCIGLTDGTSKNITAMYDPDKWTQSSGYLNVIWENGSGGTKYQALQLTSFDTGGFTLANTRVGATAHLGVQFFYLAFM
jgi:hypothetical protein